MDRDTQTFSLAFFLAIGLHTGLGYGLVHMPGMLGEPKKPIEVQVIKPQPKLTPPEAPKPPEPPKPEPPKPQPKIKQVAMAPIPNKTPPPTPPPDKPPPPPVFGVNIDSTTDGDSSFAVPVGDTTTMDPKKSGPKHKESAPPPQSSAPVGSEYHAASPLEIKEQPDIDSDLCGRSIKYPEEAEQLGIEGDVKLRIELDEKGHVHAIKVLSGLGHGLDEAAIKAMKYRSECRFRPAMGSDGKPKAYVIERYVFHFEIPR